MFKPEGRSPGSLRIAPAPQAPEGYVPCTGATVTVTGSNTTAQTNSSGYFRIDNVAAGYQTVSVVYQSYRLDVGLQVYANQTNYVKPDTGSILPKKWTVMVYICADNDLDSYALADINEMERPGSNDDVNILVQIDRRGSADGGLADPVNWKGARRYYVRPDSDTAVISSPVVYWFGANDGTDNEIDMGNPNELRSFVQWAATYYPAQHYMLVLWNHGDGWTIWRPERLTTRAICVDDTGTQLDVDQIRVALEGLPHLDIIGMDACLMQMIEVAYEFRNLAEIMVGSEESEPGTGWDYEKGLERLCASPDRSAWDVAKDIVDSYWQCHGDSFTQSAFRLDYADDLAVSIRDLKDTLMAYLSVSGPEADAIRQAMIDATVGITCYGSPYYSFYDIWDYCDGLQARVNGSANITDPAKPAISGACDAVKAQVNMTSTYSMGNGKGLSIFIPYPVGLPGTGYDWLLFGRDTRWSDIFRYYY
ncbi:MAG: clostripain-related cysteine peptidase [Bacteroidota bacterium]